MICALWHQSNVKFKFPKFHFKKIYIFLWNRKDAVLGEDFLQNYIKVVCKYTEKSSEKMLREYLKILEELMQKQREMIPRKYCEVFGKTTDICSAERFSAKLLRCFQQKY